MQKRQTSSFWDWASESTNGHRLFILTWMPMDYLLAESAFAHCSKLYFPQFYANVFKLDCYSVVWRVAILFLPHPSYD
jgi:hypothetical protein